MTLGELRLLLAQVSPDLDEHAAPWSVIGSGALMLLGMPLEDAADLDVVTSPEGAGLLRRQWAEWRVAGAPKAPDGPFQSKDFARYKLPWGRVEVMGGLRVLGEPLVIAERHPTRPIPSAAEQLRILRLMGRPKDLEKAARLEAWLAAG